MKLTEQILNELTMRRGRRTPIEHPELAKAVARRDKKTGTFDFRGEKHRYVDQPSECPNCRGDTNLQKRGKLPGGFGTWDTYCPWCDPKIRDEMRDEVGWLKSTSGDPHPRTWRAQAVPEDYSTVTKPTFEKTKGLYLEPDGWKFGELLHKDDGYKDSSFPGAQYRLPSKAGMLAVNITKTSRSPQHRYRSDSGRWFRTKIEFVGDGEPSTFHKGWLHDPEYEHVKE